jgi:hypothetical protein
LVPSGAVPTGCSGLEITCWKCKRKGLLSFLGPIASVLQESTSFDEIKARTKCQHCDARGSGHSFIIKRGIDTGD